jgi:hypothetical protein
VTNNKATYERDRNPLNRACLDGDDIQNAHIRVDGRGKWAYRTVQKTGSELKSLGDLNTTIGVSGKTFCKFLHQEATKQREEATYPLTIQWRRSETAKAKLSKGTRCTAGVYVCAEGHHVSGNALEIVIRAKDMNEQKMLATVEKKKSESNELRQRVAAVITKDDNPSTWNVDDLKNMVKWFKFPSDPALPTCRKELFEICEQTKLRTVRGAFLPDAAPVPAASILTLQALRNPMACPHLVLLL